MLRLLTRFTGLILLACGFIALIVDGTRSIAGGRLLVTSLRKGISELFPVFFQNLQAAVEGAAGFLWDPVATSLLLAPVSLTLGGLGAGLIILSHGRQTPIGYQRR